MRLTHPPPDLLAQLRAPKRLLLTSHSNPDGDAIGSQVGMFRLLRSAGHQVTVWNLDPVPRIYKAFLAGTPWHVGAIPPEAFPEGYDLVVHMECPTPERSGLPQLAELPAINLDHHLGNTHYGVSNWVVPNSASVSQMAFELARALEWEVDPATAQALYLGLATDTGNFRYSNADPIAFRHAAELVQLGASPEETAHQVYERRPLSSVRLQQAMFTTLQLTAQGRVAVAAVTREMFDQCSATADDTEGLIESLRTVDGVVAAALVRQVAPDSYKASLRSRGPVDVEKIARKLGGGGHRNAAGCMLDGPLETVFSLLAQDLRTAVEHTLEA